MLLNKANLRFIIGEIRIKNNKIQLKQVIQYKSYLQYDINQKKNFGKFILRLESYKKDRALNYLLRKEKLKV